MCSYPLTKLEYNYLLPVLRTKLLYKHPSLYYFCGSIECLSDMLSRLKGLYNNYEYVNEMVVYQCTIHGSLSPFHKSINL